MKYLKYLLYVIIGLIVIFLLVGLLVKNVEYSAQTTVNKPLEEVWAVYQDESKMSQWLEGFESIELIKGNRNEIGSEYLVKINQDGQAFEIKETLKSFEENESVNFDFDSDFMFMNYDTEIKEEDSGTTIYTHSIVSGKGIMMKGMLPFIKSSLIAQEEKNLASLKKVIEANQKNYDPVSQIQAMDSVIVEKN